MALREWVLLGGFVVCLGELIEGLVSNKPALLLLGRWLRLRLHLGILIINKLYSNEATNEQVTHQGNPFSSIK